MDGEMIGVQDRAFAAVASPWWGAGPVLAPFLDWPEGSLGDRLLTDELFGSVLRAPSLLGAKVPDAATIRSDPEQWGVAAWVLVRAVVLDGVGVGDPAVKALLEVLAPVAQAELAAGVPAYEEARREGFPPGAIVPTGQPDTPGPVFLVGSCALVHVLWTLLGEDPLGEVLDVLAPVLDGTLKGRGRVVIEALAVAFAEHCGLEEAADVELLDGLWYETSGDPLRDLVPRRDIAPPDCPRFGLDVLARLARLCRTEPVSILDPAPSGIR